MRESKSHFDDIVGTHWQQRDNTDCISSIAGGNIVLTNEFCILLSLILILMPGCQRDWIQYLADIGFLLQFRIRQACQAKLWR